MQEEQHLNNKNALEKSGKALTISQLAHLHLYDRNHVTNDDELRNAKIELSNIISVNEGKRFTTASSTILD